MARVATMIFSSQSHQPPSVMKNGSSSTRNGFTLFELLLVLTILAVIGSLVVPSLDSMMDRFRLRNAADEMRLIWDSARLEAMRTGQAQLFRCQLETNSYSITPLQMHDDANNIADGATIVSGGAAVQINSTDMGIATAVADPQVGGTTSLDESLKFVRCTVAGDFRAFDLAQSGQSADVTLLSLSQSVIFYPDGTTSSAELYVSNVAGESIGVQMRGLTGHTRVLPLIPKAGANP